MKGRRPKPTFLRLIEGNRSKRPIFADPAPAIDPKFDNGLAPPRKLRKRQQELWNTFVKPLPWLCPVDAPLAFAWVCLFAEFEASPEAMTATRIAQFRGLSAALGLDVSARARLAATVERPRADDGAAKYLT